MSSLDRKPSWWGKEDEDEDEDEDDEEVMSAADEKHSRDESYKGKTSSSSKKTSSSSSSSLTSLFRASGGGRSAALSASLEARKSPPKGVAPHTWLSDPKNLAWATKRRMVSKIANKANPSSRNTRDVFTIEGKRYALTDLYRSPLRERIGDAKSRGKAKSLDWWDAHKKQIVVGSVAAVGLYLVYTTLKQRGLEAELHERHATPVRRMMPVPRPVTKAPITPIPLQHQASGDFAGAYNYPGSWGDLSYEDYDSPEYYPFEYSWE